MSYRFKFQLIHRVGTQEQVITVESKEDYVLDLEYPLDFVEASRQLVLRALQELRCAKADKTWPPPPGYDPNKPPWLS